MKKLFKQIIFIACLGLFVITQTGCFALLVGAAAGAGGYAWVKGALEQNFNANVTQVHSAILRAMQELKLAVIEDNYDHLKGKVIAEMASGEKVTTDINAMTEKVTKVKIRVGIVGDRSKSDMILTAIKKNL